eukprot:4706252-Pleurochrysis_carterae.AAC.1
MPSELWHGKTTVKIVHRGLRAAISQINALTPNIKSNFRIALVTLTGCVQHQIESQKPTTWSTRLRKLRSLSANRLVRASRVRHYPLGKVRRYGRLQPRPHSPAPPQLSQVHSAFEKSPYRPYYGRNGEV